MQMDQSAWTIGRLLAWTTEYLARHQIADARLASEVLLARAADRRRIELYTHQGEVPPAKQVAQFRDWVRRAAEHEPIAYLVGEKEFFSLAFTVTHDVLIPRPETEMVVECVIDHCKEAGLVAPYILDMGTGSGCMAVAVLKHVTGARVVGSDTCPSALNTAQENARRHQVAERFVAIDADRLHLPPQVLPEGGFDVLMSNPPYVSREAFAGLDATVRDYEPQRALTDGEDGLSFYRAIAVDGPALLAPRGVVILEVGDGQSAGVQEILEASNKFVHRRTAKDRVVGRERVLVFARG